MSTQSATAIELHAPADVILEEGQPRMRARIYVDERGDVVFQTLGNADLHFVSAEAMTITAQTTAVMAAPVGVAIESEDGPVAITAGHSFTSTAAAGQVHQSGERIDLQAAQDIAMAADTDVAITAGHSFTSTAAAGQWHKSGARIDLQAAQEIAMAADADIVITAAANVRQSAGELHRTEGKVIDLHAAEKLREDANGVGHTYAGERVDYWTPWHGTGNRPHPPEHPYEGTDDIDWPPIDTQMPPADGGA